MTNELTYVFLLSVGAFVLAMMLTPIYTFFAYRYKFWKHQRSVSTDGKKLEVFTKLHAAKFQRNIPTMAGIISIVAITVVTLLFNLDRAQTWLPLAALVGGGIVGLIDDIINVRGLGGGVAGLRSGLKFMLIAVLGVALGWFFFSKLGIDSFHVPFVGEVAIGWLIVPLFAFAVIATGNAVNISDGLDGLAGGLLGLSFATFGVIALLQGNSMLAGFCFTVVGALLSYLWFNIYPARFFMGDVGSFAFGAALGVVAMLTDSFLLLPVIGLLFVVEAGTSLIQIASKKLFGRKIFLSAPIHHHLEASGWPETKVTMRFWVIGCVMAFIGLMLALAGGHIA
jgi:phospho-N-acetylmuramoyl-pentapeptide-transferase